MRTAFIQTLSELAGHDRRIWLLCGDLGYSVLEEFADRFTDRFVNAGIAEQNMTGVAAGLALSGKIVFTYSIANFPTIRCLEQIRNDVCYHGLDVKIVAVGGGTVYGSAGYSHHAVEDLAIMRVMPGMAVVAPGDPVETRLATRAIVDWKGPCYLRLGKSNDAVVHQLEPPFEIGRAIELRSGEDITLISIGGTLQLTLVAADVLLKEGISAQVLSMHTLSPIDEHSVLEAALRTRKIVTVEEHGAGGLASVVGEVVAASGSNARLAAVRLGRESPRACASQATLCAAHGVSVDGIVAAACSLLETRSYQPILAQR
jgi:transketolase